MSRPVTVETCFVIVLTVLSTINARIRPETLEELRHKPADTDPSSHNDHRHITQTNVEGFRHALDSSFTTSMNRDSSRFQRYGVPLMFPNVDSGTEVLPVKDRNIFRYHLSETSSKFPRENPRSYSPSRSLDSEVVLKDNKLVKSNNAHVTFPSVPLSATSFQDYKKLSFFDLPSKRFSKDGEHEDSPDLYGLSYLSAQEARDLLSDNVEPRNSRYQSDSSGAQRPFPRFSIPLRSLLLDSERSKDYNTETSEIIEPTFIVPRYVPRQLVPRPTSPTITYGVSINDGTFSRKEIRKDNGEFFSSYRDYDVSSADVGSLVPKADGDQVLVLRGSYSFTSPEGLRFRTDYTADETGYHATQVPVAEDAVSFE